MNKLEQAVRNLLDYFDRDDCGFLFDSHMEALREALDQHKPHKECECSDCLNYFTDKAHEEALAEQAERVTEGNGSEVSLETEAQEQVALESVYETIIQWDEGGGKRSRRELARRIVELSAAPVRTKDLTDDEIFELDGIRYADVDPITFARAVIAADRELNK